MKEFNANRAPKRDVDYTKMIVLPWVPQLSLKLKSIFKKFEIDTAFKPSSNLSSMLCRRNKSRLPRNSTPGVYEVSCGCGQKYVGETGSMVRTRIEQHRYSIFKENWKDSGLSEHAKTCKEIDWENVRTIKPQSEFYKRSIRESLEIMSRDTKNNGMNRDVGRYVTTAAWGTILKKIHDREER